MVLSLCTCRYSFYFFCLIGGFTLPEFSRLENKLAEKARKYGYKLLYSMHFRLAFDHSPDTQSGCPEVELVVGAQSALHNRYPATRRYSLDLQAAMNLSAD